MSLERAARVGDGIGHRPDGRAIGGAIVGAVIAGAAVVFAAPTVAVALPFGLVVTGTTAFTGLTTLLASVGTILSGAGTGLMIGGWLRASSRDITGHIITGAETVFTGPHAPKAALAHPRCRVDCHSGNFVAQGSDSVFIEREHASRVGDKTSCGGTIDEGLETTFIGGEPATLAGVDVSNDRNGLAYNVLWWVTSFGGPFAGGWRAFIQGRAFAEGQSIWRGVAETRTRAAQRWHQSPGPAGALAGFDLATAGLRAAGLPGGMSSGLVGNLLGSVRKGFRNAPSPTDVADLGVRAFGSGARLADWVARSGWRLGAP